ncbi:hypothetical protein RvY_15104-2 [Ramazzottius varieornatus]|nr:hypothetical protein RvY_15104-2 [Ramazzottius varieornatus]
MICKFSGNSFQNFSVYLADVLSLLPYVSTNILPFSAAIISPVTYQWRGPVPLLRRVTRKQEERSSSSCISQSYRRENGGSLEKVSRSTRKSSEGSANVTGRILNMALEVLRYQVMLDVN